MATRTDWYAEITNTLITEMEMAITNASLWNKMWSGMWKYGFPVRAAGVSFTGINVWILALSARKQSFEDPRWFTFDQAMEAMEARGYKKNPAWKGKADTFKGITKWLWEGEGENPHFGVKAGAKGTHVIRCNGVDLFVDSTGARAYAPKSNAPEAVKSAWNARVAAGEIRKKGFFSNIASYVVFNAEQISGLPEIIKRDLEVSETHALIQNMVTKLGIKVLEIQGCDTACYDFQKDQIVMPDRSQFTSENQWWAALLHEITHWTGHESRLNRGFGKAQNEYAFEELVAEIGSTFLCAQVGLEGNLQHPEYLASWIKVLKGDTKMVFKASTMAQKAVDYLLQSSGVVADDTDLDGAPVALDDEEAAA